MIIYARLLLKTILQFFDCTKLTQYEVNINWMNKWFSRFLANTERDLLLILHHITYGMQVVKSLMCICVCVLACAMQRSAECTSKSWHIHFQYFRSTQRILLFLLLLFSVITLSLHAWSTYHLKERKIYFHFSHLMTVFFELFVADCFATLFQILV